MKYARGSCCLFVLKTKLTWPHTHNWYSPNVLRWRSRQRIGRPYSEHRSGRELKAEEQQKPTKRGESSRKRRTKTSKATTNTGEKVGTLPSLDLRCPTRPSLDLRSSSHPSFPLPAFSHPSLPSLDLLSPTPPFLPWTCVHPPLLPWTSACLTRTCHILH